MTNEAKKLLFDILTACDEIATFVVDETREEYLQNTLLRRAVERDLEIIGEATSRLRDFDEAITEHIPDSSRIIGMRNRLIHAYAQVNDEIVWDTVQTNIPELRNIVQQLLNE